MRNTLLRIACCLAVSSAAALNVRAPSAPERAPAEFEPVQAVLFQWRLGTNNSLNAFLADHVQRAGATACIVVMDRRDRSQIERFLTRCGVPLTNVRFIVHATDTVWVRDYGAIGFYENARASLAFADFIYKPCERPHDDLAAADLYSGFRAPVYRVRTGRNALAFEGGDFLTDGFGTIFTSERAAVSNHGERQVTRAFAEFFAAENVHFLPRLTTAPPTHIDMHAKLLDEETILLADFPRGTYDPALIDTERYLASLSTPYGTPYRIFRVPMFLDYHGPLPVHYTYTNALIVNNHVLVPLFGLPSDSEALRSYEQAMPGYHVAGYDCSHSIRAGGAIHCLTREVPRERVVRIAHPRIRRTYSVGETIVFTAECWAAQRVNQVSLLVAHPNEAHTTTHEMTLEDGVYRTEVTAQAPGELRYVISAEAGGVLGYKPQNGYDGGYLTVNIVSR